MSPGEASSLAEVLALVEKHGTVVVPSRSLEKIASVDARIALHAAGVLVQAPAAVSWPCDVRGCSREIRANHQGARKALVAVCSQARPECAPVELGFEDVAQQELSVQALVGLVCALLDADADYAAVAKARERRAIGDARSPVLVGETRRGRARPRDVFWAGTPRDMDLGAFCARRERVKRKTLVLVPTSRHVPLDVAARYAAGEDVEIAALVDLLVVRGGKIALRGEGSEREGEREGDGEEPRGGEAGRGARASATRISPGIAALLGVRTWEEIRIVAVDERTVRIERVGDGGNGAAILRTFEELGLADMRQRERTPVAAWSVLLLLCHETRMRPSQYTRFGKAFAVKKAMEVLRRELRKAFGLEKDPMLAYSKPTGWAARFQVGAVREGRESY